LWIPKCHSLRETTLLMNQIEAVLHHNWGVHGGLGGYWILPGWIQLRKKMKCTPPQAPSPL
jgi:hypothetical protein